MPSGKGGTSSSQARKKTSAQHSISQNLPQKLTKVITAGTNPIHNKKAKAGPKEELTEEEIAFQNKQKAGESLSSNFEVCNAETAGNRQEGTSGGSKASAGQEGPSVNGWSGHQEEWQEMSALRRGSWCGRASRERWRSGWTIPNLALTDLLVMLVSSQETRKSLTPVTSEHTCR